MLDQELIVKSVVDSVNEVFEMMLGMEARYEGILQDAQKSESGLVSLVGITGEWGGSGVFGCSPEFANKLCVAMLGEAPDMSRGAVITDEVMDVVAEMTNMVIGNVKNYLEPVTGPLAISVPTVLHGRNFQFRNTGLRCTTLAFSQGSSTFEVRMALARNPESSQMRSKIPVLGLAAM